MRTSGFLSGYSGRTRQQGQFRPSTGFAGSLGFDCQALAHPLAVSREASAESRPGRRHRSPTFNAIALWMRRALADSAHAWALAAGVPPDLYRNPAHLEPAAGLGITMTDHSLPSRCQALKFPLPGVSWDRGGATRETVGLTEDEGAIRASLIESGD